MNRNESELNRSQSLVNRIRSLVHLNAENQCKNTISMGKYHKSAVFMRMWVLYTELERAHACGG